MPSLERGYVFPRVFSLDVSHNLEIFLSIGGIHATLFGELTAAKRGVPVQ
jgi:hypothetical protein